MKGKSDSKQRVTRQNSSNKKFQERQTNKSAKDLEELLTMGFCELAERICKGQDLHRQVKTALAAATWVVVKSTLELGPHLAHGQSLRTETPTHVGEVARGAVGDSFDVFRKNWPDISKRIEREIASDWQKTLTNLICRTGDASLKYVQRLTKRNE